MLGNLQKTIAFWKSLCYNTIYKCRLWGISTLFAAFITVRCTALFALHIKCFLNFIPYKKEVM